MFNQEEKYITIKQASKMLGVTPLTLRNWDNKGKLVAHRHPLNNYRVYKHSDISRLLTEISANTKSVSIRPHKIVRRLAVRHL